MREDMEYRGVDVNSAGNMVILLQKIQRADTEAVPGIVIFIIFSFSAPIRVNRYDGGGESFR